MKNVLAGILFNKNENNEKLPVFISISIDKSKLNGEIF